MLFLAEIPIFTSWKHQSKNVFVSKKLKIILATINLVGLNGSLTKQIANGSIPSMIFLGSSPGTGKNYSGSNYCKKKVIVRFTS